MIQEVVAYEYHCDNCGEVFGIENEGSTIFKKQEWLMDWLQNDEEWKYLNHKWCCPGCYNFDEESDDYKIKESK